MRNPIFILAFVETVPAVVEEVAEAPAVVEEVAAAPEEPKVEGTHF
jgi:hypothetical protein